MPRCGSNLDVHRQMGEEVVVHKPNEMLLIYKKEWIWVSSSEVDEPRACYTEWRKSECEKQILYINTCIGTLERWYWWSYLQGRSRDADMESRLVDPMGEAEGGLNWE